MQFLKVKFAEPNVVIFSFAFSEIIFMINSVKMGQLETLISMYETLNDRKKVKQTINIQTPKGLQDKERKRSRALPPDGWLGESSVKKRQV